MTADVEQRMGILGDDYITLHYNTTQYNTAHYNTIQYNKILYNTLRYITLHYIILHYFVNKPLSWYVVELYRPEAEKLSEK